MRVRSHQNRAKEPQAGFQAYVSDQSSGTDQPTRPSVRRLMRWATRVGEPAPELLRCAYGVIDDSGVDLEATDVIRGARQPNPQS